MVIRSWTTKIRSGDAEALGRLAARGSLRSPLGLPARAERDTLASLG